MKNFPRIFLLFCLFFVVINCGCTAQNVPADTFGIAPELPEIFQNPDLKEEATGFHQALKTRFIEGNALFMSFIALALIIGLAFCLERIIYLNLSQINTKKFLSEIENKLMNEGKDAALNLARDTRGPTASVCYQAILRADEDLEIIDKSITSYGSVRVGLLEKNLSWITLFIAVAPALGFLGTVLGMIQSFDNIQQYGDMSPTIIAGGMKFALITTVAGLIVAIILQFFYNYLLTKIEEITNSLEDDSIKILDMIINYKRLL
ncbi:MAG: MotA/TolQ/ExbB proton channel family protein [Dysgonamonadaceae bacterium]|jgi:biopolymer transport protein ExbB|nr:MotA/TolQ/ExbB proton channel family protein [Dysgonamonadaceae bacterium]